MDVGQVDAGQGRAYGYGAGRHMHLVEPQAVGTAVGVVAHLGLTLTEVEANHLVAGTHVDPHSRNSSGERAIKSSRAWTAPPTR